MARPSDYSDELAEKLCQRIAAGESVRRICMDADMPSQPTFYAWLAKHETFLKNYARAREDQADKMAEEILDIADDRYQDIDEEGRVNQEAIQRARLRVDTRKWLMSKMAPKKYGDKLAVGGDPDAPPIQHNIIQRTIVDPKEQ